MTPPITPPDAQSSAIAPRAARTNVELVAIGAAEGSAPATSLCKRWASRRGAASRRRRFSATRRAITSRLASSMISASPSAMEALLRQAFLFTCPK